jgi:hypothetical protein
MFAQLISILFRIRAQGVPKESDRKLASKHSSKVFVVKFTRNMLSNALKRGEFV